MSYAPHAYEIKPIRRLALWRLLQLRAPWLTVGYRHYVGGVEIKGPRYESLVDRLNQLQLRPCSHCIHYHVGDACCRCGATPISRTA